MPFNNPLQRAAKPPSPPHRNISNASSSNTASSTSSLEAAPIKPPPIQTRTAATTAEQLGDRESRTGTYRDRRRVETSTSPTTPRMPGDGFTQGPDGTSSSSQTATFAQSTPTQQHHQYGHSDFPAHLLPAELRPSSSGPDLASLRQRIADAQLQRNTAAAIEEQRAQRRRSSFNPDTQGREDVEDGHKKRPLSTGDVSATEDDNTAQTNQESHVRTKLRTRSSSAQVTQIVSRLRNVTASAGGSTTPISMEARKAVSLQDFTFGEVLGRGSYSTVRALIIDRGLEHRLTSVSIQPTGCSCATKGYSYTLRDQDSRSTSSRSGEEDEICEDRTRCSSFTRSSSTTKSGVILLGIIRRSGSSK